MIWQELTTPAVRDLAWACFSPGLFHSKLLEGADFPLDNCSLKMTDARRETLFQLDRDPAPLLEFLAQSHSTRLGLYFEKLWHFMLREDPGIDLIAHNLPVRDHGRTLGEFDCLYYCHRRQRHVHLELAVKFYLEVDTQPHWLGPGCRDSLEQKLAHLLSHQIRLSHTDPGRSALQKLGIGNALAEIELKGYLFAHSDQPPLPPAYNRTLPLSRWHSLDEFLSGAAASVELASWYVLPRRHWLAPCDQSLPGYGGLPEADEAFLQEHFDHRRQPQLLAACDTQGRELNRCFVAPNDWPPPRAT